MTHIELPTDHRYTYTMTVRPWGSIEHVYLIVSRHGAIHFWVTEYTAKTGPCSNTEPSGGLEAHYRQPPGYMADKAPSHDECFALKAPCWHDGTSLYASETLIPRWLNRQSEPEVFGWLVQEVDRLNPPEDEDPE